MKDNETILNQLKWDYSTLPVSHIKELLAGKREKAGHYDRETLFIKLLETYPWFTIIELLPPEEVKQLLTSNVVEKLRTPALRKKYNFVQKRLQEVI